MKEKLIIITTICIYCACLLAGCSEIDINSPKFTGGKPDPVTNYTVTSLNGGAQINFKMPTSDDLLYVKAEYVLASGLKRETRSSLYKDYLVVDGFENAGEYEIKLYSVAKGEVASDPTTVKIDVLTPPYLLTRETIGLIGTFGGVNVSFTNETSSDLSIQLFEKDEKEEWIEKHTYYTNSQKADFSVRGYEPEEREFGVCVKDRWGNVSDTLTRICLPLFEELIPKNTWRKYELPQDHTLPHPTYPQWAFEKLWDGLLGDNMFHTAPMMEVWPSCFTIDLGLTVNFSRVRLNQRISHLYNNNNVRIFEVYGSNEPNLDGSWDDSWTKMGTFEVIKPSGADLGTTTGEDTEAATAGHDFDFSPLLPSFRYVRFNILESWGRVQSVAISELTFWGEVVE